MHCFACWIKIMQDGMVVQDFKSTVDFTVRDIFLDNHNWDVFRFQHRAVIRQVEVDEVEKMLHCKDGSRGFFIYYCPVCKEPRIVYFGCNSRLCSCCGKSYTDKWSRSLKNALFDVPHRHIVMSVPEELWGVMKRFRRRVLKVYMDAAIIAINDTLSYFLRKDVMAGVVVVLHLSTATEKSPFSAIEKYPTYQSGYIKSRIGKKYAEYGGNIHDQKVS
jgi:hypothetical protein